MGKSYKKNPYISFCQVSRGASRKWKRSYNRAFRRGSRVKLNTSLKEDLDVYVEENIYKLPYADMWSSPSDGYHYYPFKEEDMFHTSAISNLYDSYEEYRLRYFKEVLRK